MRKREAEPEILPITEYSHSFLEVQYYAYKNYTGMHRMQAPQL